MSTVALALGHRFLRPELLAAALVHRSYAAERPGAGHNERMEFLGDAVLQLVITEFLYEVYPQLQEGSLAKIRAASVNRDELAAVARRIHLGESIVLGAGERHTGGAGKTSILADAMEAVIAAVYLDGGLSAARAVVLAHWEHLIREKATAPGGLDHKTRFQERLATSGRLPVYETAATGPDHARWFDATVSVEGRVWGAGSGKSKKEAEQAAACSAMQAGFARTTQ